MPDDFLGTEHTNFALNWCKFFLNIFLVNETKRRECVIVKATHGISKSIEPLYRFWEHWFSSTAFVEIVIDMNIWHWKKNTVLECSLKKTLYSNVLKNY